MCNVYFLPYSDVANTANRIFAIEKKKIIKMVPSADIQHVGSTSIPNSLTKGDVDINVRVSEQDFTEAAEKLQRSYEVHQRPNWTPTFASFKDDRTHELPLGIQLTVVGSPEDIFVQDRRLLRNDPGLLNRYNQLKLSEQGQPMKQYRVRKSMFLEKMRASLTRG